MPYMYYCIQPHLCLCHHTPVVGDSVELYLCGASHSAALPLTRHPTLQELVPAPAPGPQELDVEGIIAVIAPEAGKALQLQHTQSIRMG